MGCREDDQVFDKYKIAIEQYSKEVDRFWMRFNIFNGIQVVAIILFIKFSSSAEGSPQEYIHMRFLLAFIAILTIVINIRGIITQHAILMTIKYIEDCVMRDEEIKLFSIYEENDFFSKSGIKIFIT